VAVNSSYKDAPTRTVSAGGVDLAYRELGPKAGVPVNFLVHLAGNLDNWDPRVVDGIAAKHRVITFDNRGVGACTGKTPATIQAMAKDAVRFIRALGFDQVDLHGFSMGGMIAQDEPELVRKPDPHRHRTGRWQGHQGGRVGRAARHPPRPAESPGPQAVPLLHPDRERQA